MDLFSLAGKIILNDGSVISKLTQIDSKAKGTGTVFEDAFGRIKSSALKVAGLLDDGIGIKKLAQYSYKAAESASDLSEAQNVVEQTFKASAKSVEAWTDTTAKSAGISKTAATQYSGFMGAMLKSSGLGEQTAAQMSESLVQLTGDMSSFYNIGTSDMWEKIRSGISGETMPLKELGINMDVANLSAFALSEGIKKPYEEMSQAEQTTLRYNYLLSVTKDAQGDFGRTLGTSFANQMRVAQMNMESLGQSIGSVLLPYFMQGVTFVNQHMPQIKSVVTDAANGISSVVNAVGPTVQGVISRISGYMPQIEHAVVSAVKTISSVVQTIVPFVQPIISDIVQIAENLLPKLSGSSGDLAGKLSGVVKTALTDVKAVLDWMAQHGEAVNMAVLGVGGAFATFKAVSTVKGAIDGVKGAIDGVKKGFDTFTKISGTVSSGFETIALKGMYAGDKIKLIGQGAADGAKSIGQLALSLGKAALGFAQSAGKAAAHVLALGAHKAAVLASAAAEKAAAAAQWLLNVAMDANPIALIVLAIAALVGVFVLLWNNCKPFRDFWIGLWKDIQSAVSSAWNFIKPGLEQIAKVMTAVWTTVSSSVMAIITPLVNGIKSAWTGVSSGIHTIMNGIKTIFTSVWDFIKTYVLGVVLVFCDLITGNWKKLHEDADKLFGKLATDLAAIWNGIKQVATGVWTAISSFITGLWNGITGSAKVVWNGLVAFLATTWTSITAGITSAWNAVIDFFKNVWNNILTDISTSWNAIKNFFINFFNNEIQGWKNIWNGVSEFFRGLWNGILSVAQTAWNGIKNFFITFFNNEVANWKNIFNGFVNFFASLPSNISKIAANIGNAIVHGFDSAVSFLKNLPGQMLQWGLDMIAGLIKGIKNAIGGVKDAVTGVANSIRSVLHFSVPDEGPLADADTYGGDFIDLLSSGIKGNIGKAKAAALAAANSISDSLKVKANIGVKAFGNASGNSADLSEKATQVDNSRKTQIIINGPVNLADKGSKDATLQQLQFLAQF